MKRLFHCWVAVAAALAAVGAGPGDPPSDPTEMAGKVVADYFYSAEAEDLDAHLATRDLAPGEREKTAAFVQGVWARVGTRKVKVGRVEVVLSPGGDQALARCEVSGEVVNKETGESFAKEAAYVAVLSLRDGSWKIRRVVPEEVFRRRMVEDSLARQAQDLLEAADRDAARPPPPSPSIDLSVDSPAAGLPQDPSASSLPGEAAPQPEPPPRISRIEGEEVFIDRGTAGGIVPGRRFEVIRYREIPHPVTGKKLRLPERVGLVQVTESGPAEARCRVLESQGPLESGLALEPAETPSP